MRDKVLRSDSEWRELLTPETYQVTRRAGTERPFTNDKFPSQSGEFRCVCCGSPLFDMSDKFDSGTGWPSFVRPIANDAISEREDRSLFMRRTEILCSRCDSHLGHVFPDGPDPTGLRYCVNGIALTFHPAPADH